MEQILDQFWNALANYVDVLYLVTFMLLSYLVKTYLKDTLFALFKVNVKTVFIVLVVAALVAIPFKMLKTTDWTRIIFTYTLGTSLHELVFNWIENKIKKPPVQ